MIDDHALLGLSDGVVDVSNQRFQQRLVLLGDEIVKCFEGLCVWVTYCPGEFPMSVSSLMACDLDYGTLRVQRDRGIETMPGFVALQTSMLSFQQREQFAVLLQLIAKCFNYMFEGCIHRSMTVWKAAS